MGWRVARSLEVLRDQINAAYPQRNKASDGTIGDAAHAASVSDHNPDAGAVVRALDITHDPAHGCDIDRLTDALAASRDPRISYLIANRLITGPEYGWAWTTYYGDDPHANHFHLSVVADGRADDTRPWSIGAGAPGGDDMSARASAVIEAWSVGMPKTSDGALVAPVEWRIRDEKWQQQVAATLATLTARVDALSTPQVSLTEAQVASIGAEAATVLGSRVEDLEARIAQVAAAIAAAGQVAEGAA